ncbi:MAG: helix-turn-helix domain-containing protein [Thermoplasmata archaeon]
MTRTRERWIERIRTLLERAGYYVANTHGVRPSSFDLAARRDATLLLIKVLKNIDALDAGEASRLRELGRLFPATVLVVGQTSGSSELDDGVVYTRYEVPIVSEPTLRDYLEKAVPPFLYASPGGAFARIDGERLRFLRQTRGLSLGTLASVAGVSRRAIQLYEEGQGAEATVVERIEAFLDAPIVRPVELFLAPPARNPPKKRKGDGPRHAHSSAPFPAPTGDPLRDGVLAQLDVMGLEVTVTVRAPFDALARTPAVLLAGVGSLRTALHRAQVLHGIARVAEGHAMFIVRESIHRPSIGGLAILNVTELKRHRGPEELLEDITEREQP